MTAICYTCMDIQRRNKTRMDPSQVFVLGLMLIACPKGGNQTFNHLSIRI